MIESSRNPYSKLHKFFDDNYLEMVRLATYYTNNTYAGEDIVQESFTKMLESPNMLDDIINLKGYFKIIVKNSCINYIKRSRVIDKYQQSLVDKTDDENNANENVEILLNELSRLIKLLPDKRRRVLELAIVEEKSYSEIAQIMDISINTVKDHIKKAYAFMRKNKVDGEFLSPLILILAFSSINQI